MQTRVMQSVVKQFAFSSCSETCSRAFPQNAVAYRVGVFGGVETPLPEIPKALQNLAKVNPTVKTVKNC